MSIKKVSKKLLVEIACGILAIVSVWVGFTLINGGTFRIDGSAPGDPIQIVEIEDITQYDNIQTKQFKFIDAQTGEPALFSARDIELSEVINAVNNYLSTTPYGVCELGVLGDTLYIQQDIRVQNTGLLKLNFLSLTDNITIDTWTDTLEALYNDSQICAGSVVSHPTEVGSRHYMYIYESVDTADNNIEAQESDEQSIDNTGE